MDAPADWPYPDFDPAATADERAVLTHFLSSQRTYLENKCAGLDVEQMARRSAEPSEMSLLGLIRHMAEVERNWFRNVMDGGQVSRYYGTDDDPDGDFHAAAADPEQVVQAWAMWHREVEFAERFVAGAPNLDVTGVEKWRGPLSLRWVLTHMIEEYAQHNGHADLLRERIDGTVTTDPIDGVDAPG
jgi:Protein of unknown function (DUF664)